MPEENPAESETANLSISNGASRPPGGEPDEPPSIEDLRVELWKAVQDDILAAFQVDRIVDQTSAETATRVAAAVTSLVIAGGPEYSEHLEQAREHIKELAGIGGEASSYRAFVRMHLWDTGVRTGWWSEADVERSTSEGIEWQTVTSSAYRAAADAMDAILLRDFLSPEQFGILVEPLRRVVGSIWEIKRQPQD